MVPGSVTSIGNQAFLECGRLEGVYFQGNAPTVGLDVFSYNIKTTVYYLPGTAGWEPTFGGRPTMLWVLPNPVILTMPPGFGVETDRFGFIISWATNASVVVEASPDLANPAWSLVSTNTLNAGSSYFNDAEWRNHSQRLYRVRKQ
jgi:hypothetical protein